MNRLTAADSHSVYGTGMSPASDLPAVMGGRVGDTYVYVGLASAGAGDTRRRKPGTRVVVFFADGVIWDSSGLASSVAMMLGELVLEMMAGANLVNVEMNLKHLGFRCVNG